MQNLKRLFTKLSKTKLTLAAAESCTGGYFSYLMTEIPGSSKIFKGAIVAYSLEVKNRFLGLNKRLLQTTQGISPEISRLLAARTRNLFKSDLAVAIVGAAGPGKVNNIPAGTIFITVTSRNKSISKKLSLKGSRNKVRKLAAYEAVNLLIKLI